MLQDDFDGYTEDDVQKVARHLSVVTASLAATCSQTFQPTPSAPRVHDDDDDAQKSMTRRSGRSSQGVAPPRVAAAYSRMIR